MYASAAFIFLIGTSQVHSVYMLLALHRQGICLIKARSLEHIGSCGGTLSGLQSKLEL